MMWSAQLLKSITRSDKMPADFKADRTRNRRLGECSQAADEEQVAVRCMNTGYLTRQLSVWDVFSALFALTPIGTQPGSQRCSLTCWAAANRGGGSQRPQESGRSK